MNFKNFFYDAAHGWLEVDKDELRLLEIEDDITEFSYVKGDKVYLEEDCDAGLYLKAFTERYNSKPKIKEIDCGNNASIRNYKRYGIQN